jgi:thioredoxin-related protein
MNISKYLLAAAVSLSICQTSLAQSEIVKKAPSKIEWISFEQAVFLNDMKPKKIFIDVYTDWCGWCKRMDAGTFKDSLIANYISENYYAVKLNAETKDTIRFRDKVFVFKPEMKANELAISLLSGKMGYPSFVLMDEKYAILQPLSGYQTTEELLPLLEFYGTNAYLTTKWEEYSKK